MSIFEIILLAIGLSMDSLAVSVTSGSIIKTCSMRNVLKIGIIFAAFQAGMTVTGYLCGIGFRQLIEAFDHWIAFILLLYLGGKMIKDSFSEKEEDEKVNPLCMKTLCGLGIATSIDALAVGISLALLKTPLVPVASIVAIVTLIFSMSGVVLGHNIGRKIDLKLDLIGGIILIAIGAKILIEHTIGF